MAEKTTKPDTAKGPEVGADLDALAQQAAALEGQQQQQKADSAKAGNEDKATGIAEDLFQSLVMAREAGGAACTFMTEEKFNATWSDARLKNIASAAAAIMVKHGWTMGDVLEKYAPYIALVVALWKPAIETFKALRDARAVEAVQPGAASGSGA